MSDTIDVEHRRALLVDRQLLGAAYRPTRTIADVAAALGPIHSTDPATPYLTVHARTEASVGDVDAAFYGAGSSPRSLARFTTIRRTVFGVDRDVAAAAHQAVNVDLAVKLRRQLLAWLEASDDVTEPATDFLERTEALVLDRLSSGGAAPGAVLSADVAELRVRIDPQPGASYSRPIRITSKVLELLGVELRIIRGRPTGADFTSGAWQWELPEPGSIEVAARERTTSTDSDPLAPLIASYLTSFGPATVTDMVWWTGLTKTKVRQALRTLGAVEVALEDGSGGTEAGFRHADDRLTVPEPTQPTVSLLPGLDSTTMGWKQRSWFVDDRPAAGWFDRNGNAGPTIWVDGRVVGTWTQRADGTVVTEIDVADGTRLGGAASDLIENERRRVADWLGPVRVAWRYPTPRTKRLAG